MANIKHLQQVGPARRRLGWVLLAGLAALGVSQSAAEAQQRPAEARGGGELMKGLLFTNVRDLGEGPVIVLIHGLTAAMDWWDPIVPTLAATHRVITIDLIGHGGTEAPTTGYGIERQAALVRTVLAQLGVASATIVGHSAGGQVATAIAEIYPDIVERLVIMNTPAAEVPPEFGARILDMPVLGQILADLMTDEMIRNLLAPMFAPGVAVPDALIADARRLTFTALRQAQAAGEAYRGAMPIHQRLTQLPGQPPTLVIMGELDGIVLPGDAALYATVPGARVEIVAGVGHSPMIEAPTRTVELIAGFIAEPAIVTAEVVAPAPPPGPAPAP